MKKFIFSSIFVLIVQIFAFSQTSSWRTTPPSGSSTQKVSTPPPTVSSWRNESPSEFNRPTQTRPTVIFNNTPIGWNRWGWNRWSYWGAPISGWNSWGHYNYYDTWGYRKPARIFYYDNGKKDTIIKNRPVYNFGLQFSTSKQIGGFLAIGTKTYFILEYNSTFENDNSTYFPYGNITLVDFPLVNDLKKLKTYYVGLGKRFNRTGIHLMVGGKNEIVRYRGKDDIGYITFPKYTDNTMVLKFGVLHDFKGASIKLDYNPIINNLYLGLGLNF